MVGGNVIKYGVIFTLLVIAIVFIFDLYFYNRLTYCLLSLISTCFIVVIATTKKSSLKLELSELEIKWSERYHYLNLAYCFFWAILAFPYEVNTVNNYMFLFNILLLSIVWLTVIHKLCSVLKFRLCKWDCQV